MNLPRNREERFQGKENLKENWDYLREYVRRFMARSKVKTVNHLSKKEKRERSHYRFTSPPLDDGVECVTTYPINNPSRCEITKIVSASSNFYSRGRWLASRVAVDDTRICEFRITERQLRIDLTMWISHQDALRSTAIGIYGRRRMEDAHPIKFVEHARGAT